MKITSSDLQWQMQHHASQFSAQSTRLHVRTGLRTARTAAPAIASTGTSGTRPAAHHQTHATRHGDKPRSDRDDAPGLTPRMAMLRDLIALMTGVQAQSVHLPNGGGDTSTGSATAPVPPATPAMGLVYEQHSVREEAEVTHWSAQGVVRTADGQEIRFSVQLQMQRYWREESSTTLRLGAAAQATDPLIINFDGTAAELQDQRFSFDLDGDGQAEQVPLLAGNRGFLVFDRNHNQQVDSGQELFGPTSGNGYAELAIYDEDGNGWIDEGDAIYQRLSVWTPAAEGNGQLRTLAQAGVGALSLAAGATPFALRSSSNQALGTVRATSAYLREDGGVGTMQQVDLTA